MAKNWNPNCCGRKNTKWKKKNLGRWLIKKGHRKTLGLAVARAGTRCVQGCSLVRNLVGETVKSFKLLVVTKLSSLSLVTIGTVSKVNLTHNEILIFFELSFFIRGLCERSSEQTNYHTLTCKHWRKIDGR